MLRGTITRRTGRGELAVYLPEAGECEARVMWDDANHYGARFPEALGADALAAAELRADNPSTIPHSANGSFGAHFRQLRKERGLSLGDVANRLGGSMPTVWAWEHDKSRPVDRRLAGLAEVLGISPGALVS